MDIIYLIGIFVFFVILILFISFYLQLKRSRNFIKKMESHFIEGWKAIADKNILKGREAYEKIRIDYKRKYDKNNKVMKRITLFYNKLSELHSHQI